MQQCEVLQLQNIHKRLNKRNEKENNDPQCAGKEFSCYYTWIMLKKNWWKDTHKHHVYVYYLPYLICLWANKSKWERKDQ